MRFWYSSPQSIPTASHLHNLKSLVSIDNNVTTIFAMDAVSF